MLSGVCVSVGYAVAAMLASGSIGPQLLGLWFLVTLPATGAAWAVDGEEWSAVAIPASVAAVVVGLGLALGAVLVRLLPLGSTDVPPRLLLDAAVWLPLFASAAASLAWIRQTAGVVRLVALAFWSVAIVLALMIQPLVHGVVRLMDVEGDQVRWALAGPALGLLLLSAVAAGTWVGGRGARLPGLGMGRSA